MNTNDNYDTLHTIHYNYSFFTYKLKIRRALRSSYQIISTLLVVLPTLQLQLQLATTTTRSTTYNYNFII